MYKRAFTLAEGVVHPNSGNNNRKAAFTLAEVLTTLMVIGVVAALTIPAIIQNVGDSTLDKQKKVFRQRLEEGLHRMALEDKLAKKYTTSQFVNEMKNYFSIASICNSNNLDKCFSKNFTRGENDNYDVADLKNTQDISTNYEDSPIYGVRFTDGTSMLIATKPNCRGLSSSDTPGGVELGALTKCMRYLYDVNGNKEDNKVGSDITGNLLYGLSFEVLNNKVYHFGDCEKTKKGDTICYNEGDSTDDFCRAIGGRALTPYEAGEDIRDTLYTPEITNAWLAEDINAIEEVEFANQELARFLELQNGRITVIYDNTGGNSWWNYFYDLETFYRWYTNNTDDVPHNRMTICAAD